MSVCKISLEGGISWYRQSLCRLSVFRRSLWAILLTWVARVFSLGPLAAFFLLRHLFGVVILEDLALIHWDPWRPLNSNYGSWCLYHLGILGVSQILLWGPWGTVHEGTLVVSPFQGLAWIMQLAWKWNIFKNGGENSGKQGWICFGHSKCRTVSACNY